jgi:hypothetical protein
MAVGSFHLPQVLYSKHFLKFEDTAINDPSVISYRDYGLGGQHVSRKSDEREEVYN